jgi:LPLT family lysophospholipid transporter-like MFS transporter
MVAAGLVVGAAFAARFVNLRVVHRSLVAGIFIGVGVCLLPLVHTVTMAYVLMAFVGACSGFFLIPLDALLQKQGETDVGTGSVIAVQNLFENLSMLVMVSGYTAVSYGRVPVDDIAVAFGLLLAISMAALTLLRPSRSKASREP